MQEKEVCDATKLRNRTIPYVQKENTEKKRMEKSSEREENPKSIATDEEVSRENYERGEPLDKLIDKDSPFRRTKNQIINEPNPHFPDYIKPPYPLSKKKSKRELEVGQFKKFMEMLIALQVNIPFCDALEQMSIYAKFMKELLNGKRKLRDDKNVALAKECSEII